MGSKSSMQGATAAVRDAMQSGGAMTVTGVAGRWVAAGDEWGASDASGADTVILVRISDAEDNEVDGVARQVADAIGFADRTGGKVRTILVENDTSAFKRRKIKLPNGDYQLRTVRPKFRKALKILGAGHAARFISYHLDRTVRDPRDLEDLIDVVEGSKPRIVVDSVTGSLRLANDTDITSARIHCAIANQSSRDTARRVSRKRRQQAEEGRFGGGSRRYGFDEDGETVRPDEAEGIRFAYEIAEGMDVVHVREIARDMHRAGYLRVNGETWNAVAVRELLLRPRNAGLVVHRPTVRERVPYSPDDVVGRLRGEPIVTQDRFWNVHGKLTDATRRTNHAGTATKWFGSGIYQCECGATLRVQNKKYVSTNRRTGEQSEFQRMVYRCQKKDKGHVIAPKENLDALVIAALKGTIAKSDPAEIIGTDDTGVDLAKLRAQLAEHHERLRQAARDYDDDLITYEQRTEITRRRRAKIADVEAQLNAAAEQHNPAAKLVDADDIDAAWGGLPLSEQREILRRTLVVKVKTVGRGKRPPIHERVQIRKTKRPSAVRAA